MSDRKSLNILVALLVSPIAFLLVYNLFFIYIPLINGQGTLPDPIVFFMIFIDFSMLAVLFMHYFYSKKMYFSNAPLLIGTRRIGQLGYIVLSIFSLAILLFLLFKVFGSFDLSNMYLHNHKFYSQSKVGSSWLFFFLYAIVFVALYDNYLHGFTNYSMFYTVFFILINAATGGRGHVITYFFLLLVIYAVTWKGKNLIPVASMSIVLILATLFYNTLFRSGSESLEGYIASKSASVDTNQVYATNNALNYYFDRGACYSCFVEDMSNFFLPRSLFPNKPISNAETRRVSPEIAMIGTTQTYGIYGSSFINIGLLSIFFVPLFYYLYSYIFIRSVYSKNKNFISFSMIYAGLNAVQFVRGGIFDVRLVRLAVTLLIAYFMYHMIVALFGKRFRN